MHTSLTVIHRGSRVLTCQKLVLKCQDWGGVRAASLRSAMKRHRRSRFPGVPTLEGLSMTLTAEPTTATTSSGALLPLVALPQGELLTINEQSIPLLTDSLSQGVHVKPLRLDLE